MLLNKGCFVDKLVKFKSASCFRKKVVKNILTVRYLNNNTRTKKLGSVYLRCTKRNIFCTLVDCKSNIIKTSCSLRVPDYKNEFNERENLYTRGLLLGKLFGNKIISLGYKRIIVHIMGTSKGRFGVVRSFSKLGIDIHSIALITRTAHNGCRPLKRRRKKLRTKVVGFR
uniref:Ribosomal protein S11 n=1 Tax=Sargassum polycystum TaxID=127578 RepID=A0A1S5QNP5_9PHAE|nr:ribosomal protein S11 [Sargassum polycystum]YP_010418173.1 ribosomal protein S11 [Sargassum plagiophyllum]AMO66462.1 ribosomal protein S11 [Sargassum polycystum]USF18224.1 ribosomal protein S11 [Sargassum polycystum]USF18391.1 ribosomal protein S11 [Sargassum plagiophyllum]